MRAPEGILVAIVFIVLVVIGAAVILGEDAEAADVYIPGDWVIDTDLEFSGDEVIVRGNVAIKDGGSLTLRNTTLLIDSRRDDAFSLVVESTGNMYAYDSIISNRYTSEGYHRYFFNVYNDTVFINTDISRLYGWNQRHGGLRLYYGTHFIKGCTIHDSSTYGIYARTHVTMIETHIYSTSWTRFQISTNDRLYDINWRIENCTFSGSFNNPYSTGVSVTDGFDTQFRRYVNISHCNFDGLRYGIYSDPDWNPEFVGDAMVDITYNNFDRCDNGVRVLSAAIETRMHHNHYSVGSGQYGIVLYQGSNGNVTWQFEDIRSTALGVGTGLYLYGAGTGNHVVRDISIWNTYYGMYLLYGHCTVIDSYINVTNNNFIISNGAEMDVYNTVHTVGSGFIDTSGGRVTGWQRLNVSSVEWSDGTSITEGTMYILNETDFRIGSINLSLGPQHLDFKRWEATRMKLWNNVDALPALLDTETWFRAAPLDHLVQTPQDIVFTDDFAPKLTVDGLMEGTRINVSYLIMEGDIMERGRGLVGVEVSLDGETWHTATVTGERWDFVFNRVDDGKYDIHVRALDKAGNVGLVVVNDVIIDTMPPPINLLVEPPTATNEPLLTLNGTTEPGASIFVGNVLGWPDDNGAFVFDVPLQEGYNPLVIKIQDVAGNWNQSVYSILLDSIPPTLTLSEPEDGLITNDASVTFTGASEQDVTVTIDGTEVTVYRGAFTSDLDLSEGEHLIEVIATDRAGNGAALFRTVTVDLTVPTLTIESPGEPEFTTTDDTAFIAGRMDPEIDYVLINGERMDALPGEFAIQVVLTEGDNSFTVGVKDAAGNSAQTSIVIVRDTRSPKYSVDDIEAKDGEITKSGDDQFASTDTIVFHMRVDEHAVFTIGTDTHEGEGLFNIEHPITEGTNTITIEVADPMGNLADPYVYVVIYDKTAPTVTVTYPSDGFTTEAGEMVINGVTDDTASKIWINEIPVGIRADGTFEMTVALEMGDNVYNVRNRDRAGNEGTTSVTIDRKEKQEVSESNVGVMAIALVIGLVIGVAIMYVMGRRGGSEPDVSWDEEPNKPAPPPPPEDPPTGGTDGWNEY
jgi:hypothetical protein